uniref:Uncharacterized protein n=1 Tax=Rhizophora mucronata TaxID=61149 RepID=A0A2P2II25_RHIMU
MLMPRRVVSAFLHPHSKAHSPSSPTIPFALWNCSLLLKNRTHYCLAFTVNYTDILSNTSSVGSGQSWKQKDSIIDLNMLRAAATNPLCAFWYKVHNHHLPHMEHGSLHS